MMLRHSLNAPDAAAAIEKAVANALDAGAATPDLGGTDTTATMTAKIADRLGC